MYPLSKKCFTTDHGATNTSPSSTSVSAPIPDSLDISCKVTYLTKTPIELFPNYKAHEIPRVHSTLAPQHPPPLDTLASLVVTEQMHLP